MNGSEADVLFSIRGQFKEKPNSTLIVCFIISAVICAYMLRIFERPLSTVSGQNFNKFDTALWNVVVTMTTVGYGDVYPKSYGGRLLGIFICLWGVLLVSLFVVTISEALEFDHPQKNSYLLLQRLLFKEELRKESAVAISAMYKFKVEKRVIKKKSEREGKPIRKGRRLAKVETDFKRLMLNFKKKYTQMRKFDNATELTFLSKGIDNMGEAVEGLYRYQKQMKVSQDEVFNLVTVLTEFMAENPSPQPNSIEASLMRDQN